MEIRKRKGQTLSSLFSLLLPSLSLPIVEASQPSPTAFSVAAQVRRRRLSPLRRRRRRVGLRIFVRFCLLGSLSPAPRSPSLSVLRVEVAPSSRRRVRSLFVGFVVQVSFSLCFQQENLMDLARTAPRSTASFAFFSLKTHRSREAAPWSSFSHVFTAVQRRSWVFRRRLVFSRRKSVRLSSNHLKLEYPLSKECSNTLFEDLVRLLWITKVALEALYTLQVMSITCPVMRMRRFTRDDHLV